MLHSLPLDRPMAVFDLETTGKNVKRDRIVEICVLRIELDGSNQITTHRINPGIPIPAGASKVHGITDADVAGKPTFKRIARGLAAHLEGCDLCGFNLVRYDVKLLLAEFRRVDVPFSIEGRRLIDPCTIYHMQEKRDLTAAMRHYCGRDHEGAHGAEKDVLAALHVLNAQMTRYDHLPRTVAELHDHLRDPSAVDFEGKFLRNDEGEIVLGFSDHEGRTLEDMAHNDPGFLRWMLGKDFMDDAKVIAAEALDRAGQSVTRTYT